MSILERGNKGDLSFIKRLKHFDSDEMLKYYHEEIGKKLREACNARWDVAFTIANFVRSGSWVAYHTPTMELQRLWETANPDKKYTENPYHSPGGLDYWCSSISFLAFMRVNFGLCRTSVYNYLEVVDEFATYIEEEGKDPYYSINIEAKEFQFWQLIEMTSLSYQERLKIEPNWTREQIRAYKKELRDKFKIKSVQPAEQVEAEDKPKTEAQQRFAKYSKDDLINAVVELEEQKAAIESELQELRDRVRDFEKNSLSPNPFVRDNRTETKRDIQGCIETLLKGFDYQITLCGRKQGVKAFAGNIADRILTKYMGEKTFGSSSANNRDVDIVQIPIIS